LWAVPRGYVRFLSQPSSRASGDSLDERQIALLKELTESFGPPGFEKETAQIVKRHMQGIADSCRINKLGSVIFEKRGTAEKPLVLLPGHVDEVGFCVTSVHKHTGFLTFGPLGGWFDQVLLSQRVLVRTHLGDLHGVISAIPIHLLSDEERKQIVNKDKMYIDIGTSSRRETEALGVRIGDPVVPVSPFTLIRDGKIAMGKAFDDRLGAFVAMEVVRKLKSEGIKHPNRVVGVATTQEEVGARGARTVAFETNPDVCLTLEVDISGDVPGAANKIAPSKMGKGVAILTYDTSMIPNQPLKEFVIAVAKEAGIAHQLSIGTRGGTDAGQIHISGAGCPSVVLSVPTRHIHSHVGMFSLADLEAAVAMVTECVKKLDAATVSSFIEA